MLDSDRNWLTTKEASQISGYTPAHIIRLAQKGNILAHKKGHVWYTDYTSLKQFLVEAESNALLRRSKLRLKRLEELGSTRHHDMSLNTVAFNLKAFLATGTLFMLGGLCGFILLQALEVKLKPTDLMAGVGYITDELNEAVQLGDMAKWLLTMGK
ncbi:hypothetical protein A2392_00015 [Candidatus Kaiserbacteria bacterium RIFOXYB1_FULL_46_14]|uniref:Helix-turn-helix domain-containing protein n=1 Tax=Candidatus Kaiserbacteria bacterium RIFOXYB1_FULL_46_14 TaxID=1798531 RepID=A0A1F6FHX1_9BACT|nr:MAG: hypothetical protein A2392_00015 [Candidatus Kaiserbacteria bacterium RIFOXYB1_FULL_46_14]